MLPPHNNDQKFTLEWEQMYKEIERERQNKDTIGFEPSPLFITDETEMAQHSSTTKDALQSLLFDEDPNENAENFKQQGNTLLQKCLKANNKTKLVDVQHFYDQAMECPMTDLFLRAQILCNRSQVNMLIGNNGHAIDDAKECILVLKQLTDMNLEPSEEQLSIMNRLAEKKKQKQLSGKDMNNDDDDEDEEDVEDKKKLDPNLMTSEKRQRVSDLKLKAFFRVAKAAAGIKKYRLAIQYCEKALASNPSAQVRSEIEKVQQTAVDGLQAKFQSREEQRVRNREQRDLPVKIKQLLDDHGIVIGESEIDSAHFNQLVTDQQSGSDMSSHSSGIQILEESGRPYFHFRVVLVYDEFNQTDIIQSFSELDTFEDHMTYMFPPQGEPFPYAPMDPTAAHRYVNGNLTLSFYDQSSRKTTTDTYFKINMKDTLGKVLRHPKYRLPSGLMPVFHVVPSNSDAAKSWKPLPK